jgi:hypothetical protein
MNQLPRRQPLKTSHCKIYRQKASQKSIATALYINAFMFCCFTTETLNMEIQTKKAPRRALASAEQNVGLFVNCHGLAGDIA